LVYVRICDAVPVTGVAGRDGIDNGELLIVANVPVHEFGIQVLADAGVLICQGIPGGWVCELKEAGRDKHQDHRINGKVTLVFHDFLRLAAVAAVWCFGVHYSTPC